MLYGNVGNEMGGVFKTTGGFEIILHFFFSRSYILLNIKVVAKIV